MNIIKLSKKPKVFERMFGLSPVQFNELAETLAPQWQKVEYQRKTSQPRERKVGAGRKYVLSFPQMIAMQLLYLRTYTPYVFVGLVFGIDDGSVTRYFQKLRPLMYQKMKSLTIKKIAISEEEILKLIADATEQETERRDGSGYSGKKKKQTVKTQVVVDRLGQIRHVSSSVPGNRHDKKLYDETGIQAGLGDLGYLGTNLLVPFKSSKLRQLTKKQKAFNQIHSRVRIVVEHVLAALKQFRILAYRFRNNLKYYNQIFVIVAGIYNYKRA